MKETKQAKIGRIMNYKITFIKVKHIVIPLICLWLMGLFFFGINKIQELI